MSDRRLSSPLRGSVQRVNMNRLRGQPSSTSMPSFRFNVGDDDLEEVEPEPEPIIDKIDKIDKIERIDEGDEKEIRIPEKTPLTATSSTPITISSSTGLTSKNRSISLDSTSSSPGINDSDSKSLFSGIRESVRDRLSKTAKNLEGRIGLELPGSAVLGKKINGKTDAKIAENADAKELTVEGNLIDSSGAIKPPIELKVLAQDICSAAGKDNVPDKSSPILPSSTSVKDWPSDEKVNEVFKSPATDGSIKINFNKSSNQGNEMSNTSSITNRKNLGTVKASNNVTMSLSSLMSSKNGIADEGEELTETWEMVDFDPENSSSKADDNNMSAAKSNYDDDDADKDTSVKHELKYYFSKIGCRKNMIIWSIIVGVYCILPLPSFFSGLIIGILLVIQFGPTFQWLFFPPKPSIPDWVEKLAVIYNKEESSCQVVDSDDEKYQGWMNELPSEYNPEDYHINQSRSVYIRLEGKSLRMSWPQNGVPKRAMWDEPRHDPVFIRQRYFDMTGSKVLLKPEGLAKKRLWSKKYPMCLIINKDVNSDSIISAVSGSPECQEENIIHLFARTSREKEEWFRRFQNAASFVIQEEKLVEDLGSLKHKRSSSSGSCHSITHTPHLTSKDFQNHMLLLLSIDSQASKSSHSEKFVVPTHISSRLPSDTDLPVFDATWMNAFIGRALWDFLTKESWSKIVAEKVQKKLSKIKVPYFIEELTLTEIELGNSLPVINKVTKPYLNVRGLWTHFDITYSGSFCMTLETKLNLMRLKKSHLSSDGSSEEIKEASDTDVEINMATIDRTESLRAQLYDSDAEDSAESSSDEETSGGVAESFNDDSGSNKFAWAYSKHIAPILKKSMNKEALRSSLQSIASQAGGSASKKLLRFVDKIAQSKYFQHATDIKYVKKKMEEVSNTRLLLTVEVHNLAGTLVVNIPPPPTDRLWYGFHGNPKLWISARPKLGERQVTMTHITDWIEKKLSIEFQRVLVMPNMDDLIIPVMDAKLT